MLLPVLGSRRRKLVLDEDLLSAGLNSPKLLRDDCRLRLFRLEVGRPSVGALLPRGTLFCRDTFWAPVLVGRDGGLSAMSKLSYYYYYYYGGCCFVQV